MNKYEYLNALSNELQNKIPADEYANAMEYYDEYLHDAGPDKELEVIEALGTPQELAAKIIAEYSGRQEELASKPEKNKLSPWVIVLLVVLCSPMICGVGGAALGVAGAVIGVFAALVGCGVGFIVGGVILVGGGIGLCFTETANGLLATGTGFALIAVGIGLSLLTIVIIRGICKLIKRANMNSKRRVK